MKKEFIPYEEALALKELGFDEPCVATFHDNSGGEIEFTFGMFHHPKKNSKANTVSGTFIGKNGCYAPLYQQAFRWFRENHKLYGSYGTTSDSNENINGYTISNYINGSRNNIFTDWEVGTYEEAELACLDKLIEIVEQKNEK